MFCYTNLMVKNILRKLFNNVEWENLVVILIS